MDIRGYVLENNRGVFTDLMEWRSSLLGYRHMASAAPAAPLASVVAA